MCPGMRTGRRRCTTYGDRLIGQSVLGRDDRPVPAVGGFDSRTQSFPSSPSGSSPVGQWTCFRRGIMDYCARCGTSSRFRCPHCGQTYCDIHYSTWGYDRYGFEVKIYPRCCPSCYAPQLGSMIEEANTKSLLERCVETGERPPARHGHWAELSDCLMQTPSKTIIIEPWSARHKSRFFRERPFEVEGWPIDTAYTDDRADMRAILCSDRRWRSFRWRTPKLWWSESRSADEGPGNSSLGFRLL